MNKGLGLQKKAVLIIAAILFVILGINISVLTYIATNKYKNAILSKTAAIGEGLQRELEKVLGLGVPIDSLEGVDVKLKELTARDKAIGYALVTSASGKTLFHAEEGQKAPQAKVGDSRSSSNNTGIRTIGNFYDLSFPLLDGESKAAGTLRIGVEKQAINKQLFELLFWALGVSGLCFFISIGLVYFSISKYVTRPIKVMEKAADGIASGDLTRLIRIEGGDEVSSLGEAISRMTLNLKDMISKFGAITGSVSRATSHISSLSEGLLAIADVQKNAVDETSSSVGEMDLSISTVVKSTESLSESAGDTSSAILQMMASIEKIAENSVVFTEAAHDTASSVEEMVSTISQISSSIENLSASSEEIASSIEEVNATTKDIEQRANESVALAEAVVESSSKKGIRASDAAIAGMETIKQSVAALSGVINLLGERTGDIGKIVTVIDSVADQTNLLALNAAILASKAGEHGKGFTIVADEIKSLAERTSVSTNEIAALISSVQDMTRSSMSMAAEGLDSVEKGVSLVKGVNEALMEIVESSQASTKMAVAIRRATSEESQVIKQITDAVEGMREQTEAIARAIKEQSKGSQLIIEATEKARELSAQVKSATNEQKDGSRQIAGVMENVAGQAAQIADATIRQKEKSREIISSMEKVSNTSDKLILSSNELNSVINALKEEALNLISELEKFKV